MGTILHEALLRVLVCPVCHHGFEHVEQAWLHCSGCGRYYPILDGIPVLLADRATVDVPPA